MNKLKIGDRVRIKHSICYDDRFYNCVGYIKEIRLNPAVVNRIGINFDGIDNGVQDTSDLFWFMKEDVELWDKRHPVENTYRINPSFIKTVIYNNPATIVFWKDGTKTVVKCAEMDCYDAEKGMAMAICKKVYGNDNSFHKIFKEWEYEEPECSEVDTRSLLSDLICNLGRASNAWRIAYKAVSDKLDELKNKKNDTECPDSRKHEEKTRDYRDEIKDLIDKYGANEVADSVNQILRRRHNGDVMFHKSKIAKINIDVEERTDIE